jgi:hypothetical protein
MFDNATDTVDLDNKQGQPPEPKFWGTLPGILTASAGLVTAVGALLGVLYNIGPADNTPATTRAGIVSPAPKPSSSSTLPIPLAVVQVAGGIGQGAR